MKEYFVMILPVIYKIIDQLASIYINDQQKLSFYLLLKIFFICIME
jgi:hypothetical protein